MTKAVLADMAMNAGSIPVTDIYIWRDADEKDRGQFFR
jgi:hypothetical protein